MDYDIIVVGGGAAGFFSALIAKEANPDLKIVVLEKTSALLSKVKVSGGGRCNVTHSCFEPKQLSTYYPRGNKELLGPFHQFQPSDMIEWLSERGTELKTEEDGRMFPITDSSETIISTFLREAAHLGVEIQTKEKISSISYDPEHFYTLSREDGTTLSSKVVILATGGSREGHKLAEGLGHHIAEPIPSLFTFHVPTSPLKKLSGVAFSDVEVSLPGTLFSYAGPLLITHFGFSGPCILKLSAFAARYLHDHHYKAPMKINWVSSFTEEEVISTLLEIKEERPQKAVYLDNPFSLPKSFWTCFLENLGEKFLGCYQGLSKNDLHALANKLQNDVFQIDGKTLNKEEFVTCGGVELKEVNMKTLESKFCKGLFFAGEVLNVDGITGGFNFQNAWTTGFISGKNAAMSL